MGNVGIRITKPLYDARTAGDSDYIYNSAWPSIAQAVPNFTTTAFSGTSGGTLTHNLGKPLFTMAWDINPTLNSAIQIYPDVSSTTFVLTNRGTNPQTYNNVNLKIFNIDLSVDIEYPFIAPGTTTTGTYDNNFGFKVGRRISTSNPKGRDIDSTDMRDFIIHSRCQSPLVMAVKTEVSAVANTIRYTTPTGVASWVFGYVKTSAGLYQYAPYFNQSYPKTLIESPTTYSITYSGTDIGATLVVLRDPMFAGTNVEATY